MPCCKGKSVFPTKREQVTTLVLSVANVIAHAIRTGKVVAEKSLVEKRVSICKNCRHLTDNRCNICGCFINTKAGLASERCPLKLW